MSWLGAEAEWASHILVGSLENSTDSERKVLVTRYKLTVVRNSFVLVDNDSGRKNGVLIIFD